MKVASAILLAIGVSYAQIGSLSTPFRGLTRVYLAPEKFNFQCRAIDGYPLTVGFPKYSLGLCASRKPMPTETLRVNEILSVPAIGGPWTFPFGCREFLKHCTTSCGNQRADVYCVPSMDANQFLGACACSLYKTPISFRDPRIRRIGSAESSEATAEPLISNTYQSKPFPSVWLI
jgi:hypothetical protein